MIGFQAEEGRVYAAEIPERNRTWAERSSQQEGLPHMLPHLARRPRGSFPAFLREGNLPVLPTMVPILYYILCIQLYPG